MLLKQGSYVRDVDGGEAADRCIPRFYIECEQTMVDGAPVFTDKEMVEIITPGDNLKKPVQYVNDTHRQRWPKAYAAFKANQELPTDGIPLEEWPVLRPSQLKMLKSLSFRTVEDIARMDENAMRTVGMGGRELKKMAIVFIDDSQRNAIANKAIADAAKFEQLSSELKAQNDRLNSEIARLGEQIRALMFRQQTDDQNIGSAPGAQRSYAEPQSQFPAPQSPFGNLSGRRTRDELRTLNDTRGVSAPEAPPGEVLEMQVPAKAQAKRGAAAHKPDCTCRFCQNKRASQVAHQP